LEQQIVKEELERLTGAKFEPGEPTEGFRPFGEKIEWYLRSPYIEQVKSMYYANASWKNTDGTVYIRGLSVGNYLAWAEQSYGEDGVKKAMAMDFTRFNQKETREQFAKQFPEVESRIARYERICLELSNSAMQFSLFLESRVNNVSFYLEASLRPRGMTSEALRSRVGTLIMGLKEASSEIDKFEAMRSILDR
jgi:hypothetical protein